MAITQKNRILAINTALGADVLGVRSIAVQEQISRLFQIEAELSSEDGTLNFDEVVGHNVTLRLQVAEKGTRYFNGYVSRFVQLANRGRYANYHATIVPWLWFLTRTADCRMFQQKSVTDIIEAVLKAHGYTDYQLKLSGTYTPREYCVQYRETDFNFISRLMEQAGIHYYFEHDNGKHTLILADSASAHSPFPDYGEITFHESEKGVHINEVVTDWTIEKEVQPVAYVLNDFNFETPKTSLLSNSIVTRQHGGAVFEIYDYPGEYAVHGEGDTLAQVRLDELQTQFETLHGQGTARGIAAGHTFTLKSHPRNDQNREYLVTGMSLRADAGEYASGEDAGEFFSCNFTVIDAQQNFQPARLTPKPIVQGPQTAIVAGTKGEEIYTDQYGRVKVLFPWDRYSTADENSSCWIRVSQEWAGKKWGAIYLPRIGQEVIVEFLEGDPDRPIITGRVYNANTMPPYPLPAEQTKSTLKSNSTKGGQGFNEIRFEDKKGSEQIFIHGEFNQDVRIKNDSLEWVGNDRHLIVTNDQYEQVGGDKHFTLTGDHLEQISGDHGVTVKGDHLVSIKGADNLTVKGDQKIEINGDASFNTDKNLNQAASQKISINAGGDFHGKAGQNYAMVAGMAVHLKGGMTVVVEAGTELSLKVGGNFIDINSGGVFITGTMVMINSGGAAGSGSGSSPTAPVAPDAPDAPKAPKVADDATPGTVEDAPTAPQPPKATTFSDAAQVLQMAAQDGTPLCEKCEAAKKQQAAGANP